MNAKPMIGIRRTWMVAALALALWLSAGLLLVPSLITWVYDSGLLPAIADRQMEFYHDQWSSIVWFGAAGGLAASLFLSVIRRPQVAERVVPDARPSDLGAIRILVAGILLVSTLWEDLGSTAALPAELMNPLGVMKLVALLPGYELMARSESALTLLKWLTALVLLMAAIGWKTRATVPAGVVLYLILGGWIRQYAWFYHTGLLALYLLTVLAFLPSGRGLSVDRLLRVRRGVPVAPEVPSRQFGWARYAVWVTLALPYAAAGFSKLRNGGLYWWEASNFKFILFQSTLRPMEFDFSLSLALASSPDWLFEAMALTAVLGEILYIMVLFSRWARWIVPATMLLMHVAILFMQNILFFDLILLQLIFFNFRPLLAAFQHDVPVLRHHFAADRSHVPRSPDVTSPNALYGRRLVVPVTVLLTVCWVFRVEFYPFTGMQMFSGKRTEPVVYEWPIAYLESGESIRAPIEESIPAMSDSRFRRVLQMAFEKDRQHVSRAFMQAVVDRWNRHADEGEKIRRIEIQRWEWNYLTQPTDPDRGQIKDRVVYSFPLKERS